MTRPSSEQSELTVTDAAAWRRWLRRHHADSEGVWLALAKKGVTEPTSLGYEAAIEEALCFGWIDGQARRADDATYRQRFTPRRRNSQWSQSNCARVQRLTAAGRMGPAGLAEVERARADGRWVAAYAGQAGMQTPADLAAALRQAPRAQQMFDLLTKQNRYAMQYRLHTAKRAATRKRLIEKFVVMLSRGETLYPQRRRLEQ